MQSVATVSVENQTDGALRLLVSHVKKRIAGEHFISGFAIAYVSLCDDSASDNLF